MFFNDHSLELFTSVMPQLRDFLKIREKKIAIYSNSNINI
jgi:hypothetical protein